LHDSTPLKLPKLKTRRRKISTSRQNFGTSPTHGKWLATKAWDDLLSNITNGLKKYKRFNNDANKVSV
jgi:hypothetical protein